MNRNQYGDIFEVRDQYWCHLLGTLAEIIRHFVFVKVSKQQVILETSNHGSNSPGNTWALLLLSPQACKSLSHPPKTEGSGVSITQSLLSSS